MAASKTRLDRVVWLRKRTEDGALTVLATARQVLGNAQERLAGAIRDSRADYRDQDDSAFWMVEEAAHRRALQVASVARLDVSRAAAGEAAARDGYSRAHREAEAISRIADRKRADQDKVKAKLELRRLDELGTISFRRVQASRG
jgi:flagellar export protein FliJ